MAIYIKSCVQDTFTISNYLLTISNASASEWLDYPEEMFTLYHTDSDIYHRKAIKTIWCTAYRLASNLQHHCLITHIN